MQTAHPCSDFNTDTWLHLLGPFRATHDKFKDGAALTLEDQRAGKASLREPRIGEAKLDYLPPDEEHKFKEALPAIDRPHFSNCNCWRGFEQRITEEQLQEWK